MSNFFSCSRVELYWRAGLLKTALQKNTENNNQGNITLFSQNYSEINNVPSNIFIGKIENTTTLDYFYSTIYGKEKSEILLENTSKELEVHNYKKFTSNSL